MYYPKLYKPHRLQRCSHIIKTRMHFFHNRSDYQNQLRWMDHVALQKEKKRWNVKQDDITKEEDQSEKDEKAEALFSREDEGDLGEVIKIKSVD